MKRRQLDMGSVEDVTVQNESIDIRETIDEILKSLGSKIARAHMQVTDNDCFHSINNYRV